MNIMSNMPDISGPANPETAMQGSYNPSHYTCDVHGEPRKRSTCRMCNAAYQRAYLKRRRVELPGKEMWRRSRERARQLGVAFEIPDTLSIPDFCPVLGLPLTPGGQRSATSPSLDRIDPDLGYLPGNVRVISDKANRLKGNRTVEKLLELSLTGPTELRADYAKVAAYVDRELLLKEVRSKAQVPGTVGSEWRKIETFLEAAFQRKPL